MEAPHSSSSYSSKTVSSEAQLKQKVIDYKRIYFFLKLSGIALLAAVIIYILLFAFGAGKIYQPLESDLNLGNRIAADSSGRLIAVSVYNNNNDTTVAIMVSADSGRHFEQLGGPWKMEYKYGVSSINFISVAPDNKSIVAAGYKCIYLKAADADSFTCINTAKLASRYINIAGLCFVPGTDSVYVYGNGGDIFCFNYKHYDSFAVGHLQNIIALLSMSINSSKEIVVTQGGGGVYINNHFADLTNYAAANYRNDGRLRTYIDSSEASISADTTIVQPVLVDTASLMMADSSASYNYTDTMHRDSIKRQK